MKIFIAVGWRGLMKNSGGMRDLKSLFCELTIPNFSQKKIHRSAEDGASTGRGSTVGTLSLS